MKAITQHTLWGGRYFFGFSQPYTSQSYTLSLREGSSYENKTEHLKDFRRH